MTRSRRSLCILHTNDIHSHFEQMPKIATAIKQEQAAFAPLEALVLDVGDHMDRMRLETEGSDGVANVDILNETGYEAVVLGNNEGLTYTSDVLERTYRGRSNFAVVASNLFLQSTGKPAPWTVPYHIAHRNGLRIGIVGVTAMFTAFYELLGWDVRDPFDIVAEWTGVLRPKVDVLVVLSHLGFANDQRMAERVPGIDIILGGHTHHLIEQTMCVGQTYICAAGKFGQYVGRVELEYDLEDRRITHASSRVIPVDSYPDDAAVVRIIEHYRESGRQRLQQNVATLSHEMPLEWHRESPLGNLLAAGLREWTGAEIGLVNAGQLLEGLPAGNVTREMLLRICPSPINPCRMTLTGEHIRVALEEALDGDYTHKPIRGFGFRGELLGTLCLDGMRVEYVPDNPKYERITQAWVGDRLLVPDQTYTVGTIDMFTFNVGYTTLAQGRDVRYFLPEFLRDLLARFLSEPAAMELSFNERWRNCNK